MTRRHAREGCAVTQGRRSHNCKLTAGKIQIGMKVIDRRETGRGERGGGGQRREAQRERETETERQRERSRQQIHVLDELFGLSGTDRGIQQLEQQLKEANNVYFRTIRRRTQQQKRKSQPKPEEQEDSNNDNKEEGSRYVEEGQSSSKQQPEEHKRGEEEDGGSVVPDVSHMDMWMV